MAKRKTRSASARKLNNADVLAMAARIDASRNPPIDPMEQAAPKCPMCGRGHSFGSCG